MCSGTSVRFSQVLRKKFISFSQVSAFPSRVVMTPNLILWIYIALLIAGGLIGFFKAGSKASIIASIAFAIPLSLCAAGVINVHWVADVILVVLVLFFGFRFSKSRRFMPSGLMAILSAAALVGRLLLK